MKALETAGERRIRKLRALSEKVGGVVNLADKCGVSSQNLRHLLSGVKLPPKLNGEQNERSPSDELCRRIEAGLELPRGWMDNDEAVGDLPLDVLTLAREVNGLAEPVRSLALAALTNQVSMMVALHQAAAAQQPTPAPSPEPTPQPVRRRSDR